MESMTNSVISPVRRTLNISERLKGVDQMNDVLLNAYEWILGTDLINNESEPSSEWLPIINTKLQKYKTISSLIGAALAREENSFNIRMKLPEDTLIAIFLELDMDSRIYASHVCHKWRATALGAAALWNVIDMSYPIKPGLLEAQILRSGLSPLHLQFLVLFDRNRPINLNMPQLSGTTWRRVRSISQIVSDNLPALESIPDLQSLDILVNNSAFFSPKIPIFPKLQHLCVWTARTNTFNNNNRHLRTLHLRKSHYSVGVMWKQISICPNLEELLLDDPLTASPKDQILLASTWERSKPKALKLLVLQDITKPILSSILEEIIIDSTTDLRIHSTSIPHIIKLPRQDAALLVHVDKTEGVISYGHQLSSTLIRSPLTFENDELVLPEICPMHLIEEIVISGVPISTIANLACYTQLQRLSFAHLPSPIGQTRRTLSFILSRDLVTSCPSLIFLGIAIIKSKPVMRFRDDSEKDISDFLEWWVEAHSSKFATIRIQDDIKPGRWAVLKAGLLKNLGVLELAEVSLDPSFHLPASPRQFTANCPKKNSVRIPTSFAQLS